MHTPLPRRALRAGIALALAAGTLSTLSMSPASAAVDYSAIKINEVNSTLAPGDWIELVNTGDAVVDLSGVVVKDNDDTRTDTLAADTTIEAGGFLLLSTGAQFSFGLGQGDAARIFEPGGTTLIDGYTWPANTHAATNGRCADGIGEFVVGLAPTPGAANACPSPFDPMDVKLNEVESNGDPVADWVEVTNTGDVPADISGWRLKDSGATNPFVVIPDNTVIQPGAFFATYTEFPPPGFGLGVDDTVSLFQADGTTLVDAYSWSGGHAGTTFGRCADGIGDWQETTVSTRGTANACSPIRINEIVSDPSDSVELVNLSGAPIDVAGWVIKDSGDTDPTTLPSPSVVPANGHLLVTTLAAGLGSADGARLFDPTAKLIDSYAWSVHGVPSYGRCKDGVGAFALTAAVTPGAVNQCLGLETAPWPGSQSVAVSDDVATFNQDASGVVFDPSDANTLWVSQNKAGTLWKMTRSGSTWVPATGWAGGKNPLYNNGTGAPDSEGITIGPDGAVYLATERDNSVSGVSKNAVLRYEPGTSMSATDEWSLNALLPTLGANLGLEGITWIPDSHLTAGGFADASTSAAYDPADYPNHGTGLYVVAVEGTGLLYVVALEQTAAVQEAAHLVATLDPQLRTNAGPPGAMDVTWDAEQERLWAVCDDSCDGLTVTMELDEAGEFVVDTAYDRPLGMPNLNNEGLAIAPRSTCVDGRKEVVWTDDGDTDGHSLRSGTITCEALPTTPVTPDTPTPTTPVTPVTPVTTTPDGPVAKQVAQIITAKKTVRGTTGERVTFRLKVKTAAGSATGVVKVKVKGLKGALKVRLKDGRAVVRLPRFARAGTRKVLVTYLGNETTTRATLKIRAVIGG